MHLSRAFLLLCLPGCFTLSLPRVLKGTVGGTLVMKCQYGAGDEGHRKFWCRGATWQGCTRVIEMEQAEEEVKHGRVTLRHDPSERSFLMIIVDLEEGDADTYWCGVHKAGSASQTPMAVIVFPGSATTTGRTMALPPSATKTPTSAGGLAPPCPSPSPSPSPPTWLFLLTTGFLVLAVLKVILGLSFGCAAIQLAWLQRHS
ncbi:CMRF35-like molecule 3 [Choloepus didactylus]|uniref:CMRF35-like molecule 3 n=1 Tax=Choloepus didactylus TaxID=27675 RepID=UPI00189E4F2E|nr:CMRF35-like molecule 3 [Choloepus didactylus]